MIKCPHCGEPIQDEDYGMVQCPSCMNFVMINMDGKLVVNDEEAESGEQEPDSNAEISSDELPVYDPGPQVESEQINVGELIANHAQENAEVSDQDGIFEYMGGESPSEANTNGDEDVFAEDIEEQNPSGDSFSVGEEGADSWSMSGDEPSQVNDLRLDPADSEGDLESGLEGSDNQYEEDVDRELDSLGGANYEEEADASSEEYAAEEQSAEDPVEEDQYDSPLEDMFSGGNGGAEPVPEGEPNPEDPLNISGFANSEASQGLDGPYVYQVLVKGIDTKEIRESLREVLEDQKFAWDVDQMMQSIHHGEMLLDSVNPVKAFILVVRLRSLPVEVSWKQYDDSSSEF